MEMIDALHQLELTYRLGILALMVVTGLLLTRDYLTEIIECLPHTFGGYVDTTFGVVMFVAFIMSIIAVVRFGVQIIIGV